MGARLTYVNIPVLKETTCGDVSGDDVGGRVKTSAADVVDGDGERLPGGNASRSSSEERYDDCWIGGRQPTTVPLSFRGGVPPYSRASLSYVCELRYSVYLWSPYVIGQTIIFSSCDFFLLLLLLLLLSFFPRLISAAAGWMSTILPHMVWP